MRGAVNMYMTMSCTRRRNYSPPHIMLGPGPAGMGRRRARARRTLGGMVGHLGGSLLLVLANGPADERSLRCEALAHQVQPKERCRVRDKALLIRRPRACGIVAQQGEGTDTGLPIRVEEWDAERGARQPDAVRRAAAGADADCVAEAHGACNHLADSLLEFVRKKVKERTTRRTGAVSRCRRRDQQRRRFTAAAGRQCVQSRPMCLEARHCPMQADSQRPRLGRQRVER